MDVLNTAWSTILTAAAYTVGVVAFFVQVLQVRNLQRQNKKLEEEILKLQDDRRVRTGTLQIATFEEIERFARAESRYHKQSVAVLSVAVCAFTVGGALQFQDYSAMSKRASIAEAAATQAEQQRLLAEEKSTKATRDLATVKVQMEIAAVMAEGRKVRPETDHPPSKTQPAPLKPSRPTDLRITLSWNSPSDVDLYVMDPEGETIFWGRPFTSGGRLDQDRRNGPGSETIYWPSGKAPRGKYRVWTMLWEGEAADAAIEVSMPGKDLNFSKELSRTRNLVFVTEFEY